ncbi:hypothetical protein FOB58_003467 [Candida parapsilosis]|uniref:TPR_REGION domain-containing protein n=2 Tax=Candida parapsilosis TaxID=5480 RepID=G8BI35_CANPC|nr:uncharacterized protein CPAR2_401020 [Candida parapsilosis]KAF6046994.1 hypothetical protein FOB60_004530 [Candida parapsilosis]KAF6047389.1 hypothetical protein FOB58_003467 [Candida parapsilosis]KAF6050640.1 hypothetical protein FOB59_002886 [Candida parapsilosis]KAF6061759.1 hypothetical protein FOB61_004516 [Candida parapsilosis]KAI5902445.1 F-box protein pof7 [Candida parapsilosis]
MPSTDDEAILLFEKATYLEEQGRMSDAVNIYRKAFKLNSNIDLIYRSTYSNKHISKEKGKNALIRVDERKVSSINVDELINSFSNVHLETPSEHPDDAPSILLHLPRDIWCHIFEILILTTPESWFNMSITCKKMAHIGFGNSTYQYLCNLIYPKQVYEENEAYRSRLVPRGELPIPSDQLLILPHYKSWKNMLHERSFIKYGGCYISIVNYYSEGGKDENSLSWTNPVRTITYYRYLRFYPNGTVAKMLSVLPPDRVVPWFSTERHFIPDAEQNEATRIYQGVFTINSSGEVHVRIDNGSTSYLTFHYYFVIKSLGQFKHGKLNWTKYYAVRKATSPDDDRVGEIMEYSIRNEKPFKFSRVKSYSLE